jgi:hypothetical protein
MRILLIPHWCPIVKKAESLNFFLFFDFTSLKLPYLRKVKKIPPDKVALKIVC